MLGYHFLKALAECKTQVRFEKANKEACLAFVTDEISKVQTLRDEGTKFGPMFADFILNIVCYQSSHLTMSSHLSLIKHLNSNTILQMMIEMTGGLFNLFFFQRCISITDAD